jgi:hypothetical protein
VGDSRCLFILSDATVPELVYFVCVASRDRKPARTRKVGLLYGSNPETCPVRTMRAWLEGAAIESGPIFRSVTRPGKLGGRMSGPAVALVVKKYAGTLGFDTAVYSGHSLRAGLLTS